MYIIRSSSACITAKLVNKDITDVFSHWINNHIHCGYSEVYLCSLIWKITNANGFGLMAMVSLCWLYDMVNGQDVSLIWVLMMYCIAYLLIHCLWQADLILIVPTNGQAWWFISMTSFVTMTTMGIISQIAWYDVVSLKCTINKDW